MSASADENPRDGSDSMMVVSGETSDASAPRGAAAAPAPSSPRLEEQHVHVDRRVLEAMIKGIILYGEKENPRKKRREPKMYYMVEIYRRSLAIGRGILQSGITFFATRKTRLFFCRRKM